MHAGRSITTYAGVALALIASSGLTACGSDSAESDSGKISYAIWDENQKPAMEKIASAFEEDHPGVDVDIQVTPNSQYWTKLQTAMSGGSGPDVFWMNGPNFGLYASEGQIAPLTDTDMDASAYPEGLVDLYTYDGELYGAPKDFDTVALWYNKKLFDAAGVEPPTADWTWEDVRTAAKKLTDKKAGVYGIGAPAYSQENYFDTIAQAGGEVINDDHTKTGLGEPEALEGVQYWLDFIADGSSPTAQQMTDTLAEDSFQAGKIAMLYQASYMALPFSESEVADQLQVVPMPKGPTGNQSIIHGLANVANASSPDLEVAQEFAAFASGPEAAEIQAETGTVIPALDGTQQQWVDSMPQYDLQVFIDAVETAVPYPISENTSAWATPMGETMTQIWAGSVEPEEGLADISSQMQKALDEEQ